MRARLLAAFLLLVAPALAGCSGGDGGREPLPAEWRGRDLRQPGWVNETLQAGETLALEYQWTSGKRVAWDWVVVAPVQSRDPVFTAYVHFQIVRMDGGDARPLVAHDAQEGEGERTIVQAGTHQIDWMNEWTQPVTIALLAPDGARRIVYPPGQGPGCLTTQGRAAEACLAVPSLG